MTARLQLRVGGKWLNEVAPWGDLEFSTRWPLGCHEASWAMSFRSTARRNVLTAGQSVEIYAGSSRIWLGTLGQPDWSEGTFTADGLYSFASGPAISPAGLATSRADIAIDGAIGDGVPWLGRDNVPSQGATGVTATTDGTNTISTILDDVATEAGMRWAIFADGIVRMAADPTTPTWRLAPGVIDFGYDDQSFATILKVRYLDSTTSTYTTLTVQDAAAVAKFGPVREALDLTTYGPLSAARATAKAQGILTLGRSRLGWTNSVEVGPWHLTTLGGIPADLSMVQAGQSVRVPVWDEFAAKPYRDLVLGEVKYAAGASTVTLAPVDTQPQTLADVTEAVMTRARKKPVTA